MQSGNRKFYSTESALIHFTDKLLNNMDQRKMLVIILLDMSKAFDSIRHDEWCIGICMTDAKLGFEGFPGYASG